MAKVEYNMDNCMKCQCPGCPVQTESACINAKRSKWEEMRKEMEVIIMEGGEMGKMEAGEMAGRSGMMEEMAMMDPKDMIGLYCAQAIGKSDCGDLDTAKSCQCPTCPV